MLKGKTAVVTGASRGLGRAIALHMARAGANVAVVYAGNQAAAADTAVRILADFEATKALTEAVIAEFGGIDILVNNAGIVRDSLVLSMKEQDFDAVVNTSLKGAFNMIRHTYQHFMKKRAGRIINISSIAGIMGNAGQANYASAKAGVIGLTKSVARELAARGVTCNAIAPGFIETDMTDALPEKVKERALEAIPVRRMGAPDDVAALAVFLAGDGAGYITGEVIRVDGGLCM